MVRLDHLALPVRQHAVSREWYTKNLGLEVEREIPERKTVALRLWGYGAELRDPDGYLVYLWDEKSMREKGGTA